MDKNGPTPRHLKESATGLTDNCAGVHPNSPAGNPGPGHFSLRQPLGTGSNNLYYMRPGPLHLAEASALTDLNSTYDGAKCIYDAYRRAETYAPKAIADETGRNLEELLKGIVPALLMMAAVLAATTLFGAAVGAVVGALGGGVGAVPAAGVGAKVGFEVGFVMLNWLGLNFLIVHIASGLGEVAGWLLNGTRRAWDAGGKEASARNAEVDKAAREIARAVGVLFRLVLEAIVLYVLAKGSAAVAQRVAGLVGNLKQSRLGTGFAQWVERNIEGLVNDSRFNPNLRKSAKGGQSQGTTPPETPPAKADPKNAAQHEKYKQDLRRQMEKPSITDAELQRLVNEQYRPGAKVGSGSTADAIRHERATGQMVGGRSHSQKGEDSIRALQRWLDKHPNAKPGDRAAAENIIMDLQDALGK